MGHPEEVQHEGILQEGILILENTQHSSKPPNLHLPTINHKLKMNDQLKHFSRDENNDLVKGDCTFCKLNKMARPEGESYRHIFVEYRFIREALDPVAKKYNVEIPDSDEHGEQIIYFFPQEGKWKEFRTNIFYLIYNSYINKLRLRKETPSSITFQSRLKMKLKRWKSQILVTKTLLETNY